ncbi:MAG: hypothetical protein ACUVWN_02970 [bacterium]
MSGHDIYELIGLREDPFHINPDPKYFYHTTGNDEELQRLYLSMENKNRLNIITKDIIKQHGDMEVKLYGTRKIRKV